MIQSSAVRYTTAVLLPLIALLAQWILSPYAGGMSHFLLFPTVFFVVFTMGVIPGLVSMIIASIGGDYFFVEPSFQFKIFVTLASTTKFAIFAGSTLLAIWAITKLRRNEQKLSQQLAIKSESEEKFQVMADTAPVMVWISNAEKQCTWFNRAWLDFSGSEIQSESGNGWTERIHPDDLDGYIKTFVDNFDARKEFYSEFRRLHHTGEYRWVSSTGVPRFESPGHFSGYVGASMDIEEQKQSQAALLQTTQKLEQAVRVRDDFLSIASHELKTPLTSLKLQSQFVNRAVEKGELGAFSPERVRAMSERSDKQITRLTRLVDDMLDVSRISTGMLVIEKEEFDLVDLVKDVLDRMQQQFLESQGQAPTLFFSGETTGFWDRHRIDQVIVNLFSNAIRYGEKKPISILVTAETGVVFLKVKDQGIGVSPENQERIFKRFERAVNSTEISGLGLGLFISAQIAASHGGAITVESILGEGATFILSLPKRSSVEPNHERQPLVE